MMPSDKYQNKPQKNIIYKFLAMQILYQLFIWSLVVRIHSFRNAINKIPIMHNLFLLVMSQPKRMDKLI